ncbi:MAG: metallophosphoesterase [Acidobacteriota bacterium]|nr:metallophosphoesterase [Acidobacteriota bacterium]
MDEALSNRQAKLRTGGSGPPTLAGAVRPDTPHPALQEALAYCAKQAPAQPFQTGAADALPPGEDEGTLCFCSEAAIKLAEAKILCDQEACQRYEDDLTKFGECDPLYADAAVKYAEFFIAQCGKIPYRVYKDLSDFVIDDKLPAKARVAILGDWGTGQQAALNVLRQISAKKPDVVIHLGDVYYSGTNFEDQNYFYQPWSAVLNLAAARIPTFTLSGNHDMYSGGFGYYNLIDQLGQPASYFCLRNDDWQLLAMDTGLHDANPSWNGAAATYLEDTELAWHKDKIDSAGSRRTILLSHHPLFTAYENIDGGPVNLRLYSQLNAFFPSVDAWLWGHEHDFVVYAPYQGVARARCIGHGAFPVSLEEQPSASRFPRVPVMKQDASGKNITLGSTAGMMNHGYAILDLNGSSAAIAYYQDSDEQTPLFEETIP